MRNMMISCVRLGAILALLTLTVCLVFCQAEDMVALLLSKAAAVPAVLLLRKAWGMWGDDPLVARVIR